MRHEVRKMARMVDELTIFFMEYYTDSLNITIKNLPDKGIITVEAIKPDKMEECISALEEFLSYPRESEMEEYYWELAGEADSAGELALVGTMTDEAMIEYDEEKVAIKLIRNK